MDSHSFRIIAAELIRLLDGARLEKIHGPVPGLYAFVLFAQGKKRRLLFRFERQRPLLLFSAVKPDNPAVPSAAVMRLRKYCQGRRLGPGRADFAARQLLFPLAAAPGEKGMWLLLDLAAGAFVAPEPPPGFGEAPAWPDASVTDELCGIAWQKRQKEGPWQRWAVLTPFLRETLAALDPLEGRALMVDLEAGGGELFLYADQHGTPALYSAWPLPEPLLERRRLAPLLTAADEGLAFAPWQAPAAELLPGYPSLACVTLVDEPVLFSALGDMLRKREREPERKADKKTSRLLAKLAGEETRLRAMLALREDAKALQAELWRYPADARRDAVDVTDAQGRVRRVELDPLVSVRDNMQRMFKQSDRGARGLAMLEERRRGLLRTDGPAPPTPTDDALHRSSETRGIGAGTAAPDAHELSGPGAEQPGPDTASRNSGAREFPYPEGQNAPRGVARYLSSDGFVLLRGKNAKGNQLLLKLGKGHDLWLHAEDGPSAHLLIRRSHAVEDVPERTLQEAATLVAEKSWQRQDARARIMVALAKYVHPVKGGAPGQVRVDQVLQSLVVALNADGSENGTIA